MSQPILLHLTASFLFRMPKCLTFNFKLNTLSSLVTVQLQSVWLSVKNYDLFALEHESAPRLLQQSSRSSQQHRNH